jgi:glycosyltransferase involved in cell wall biosynthesis
MRIAIVTAFIYGKHLGGIGTHVRFMAQEFRRLGHDVRIFRPAWEEEIVSAPEDVQWVNYGQRPFNAVAQSGGGIGLLAGFITKASYALRVQRLIEQVRAWKPDLIWQHDFSSSWLATKHLSRSYPVVLTNHTGEYLFIKKLPAHQTLLSLLLSHYSAIIGPSTELTPTFLKNTYTIFNGVDTELFCSVDKARKQELREQLFHTNKRFVVFCPRRWAPTKGVIYLAKAIRKLEQNPHAKDFLFVFAGDDYLSYPKYAEEVNEVLAGSKVAMMRLGTLSIEDIVRYYQASDLVVIPSLMEAVSISALEAMATGVPVLSTDVGGMPEIIKHGETGYLVPSENDTALLEGLISAYQDTQRQRISQQAIKLVQEHYSWRHIAVETEKILLESLANHQIKQSK